MLWEETATLSKISALKMKAVGFCETLVPIYHIRLHRAKSIEDHMLLLTATRTSTLPYFLHFYKTFLYSYVSKISCTRLYCVAFNYRGQILSSLYVWVHYMFQYSQSYQVFLKKKKKKSLTCWCHFNLS